MHVCYRFSIYFYPAKPLSAEDSKNEKVTVKPLVHLPFNGVFIVRFCATVIKTLI